MIPSKFVTTRQWGANESRKATPASHPMRHARGVTAHWVGPGRGVVWAHHRCAHMVQAIERHHEYGNGWGDIAYNALVCPHGFVFEGRGVNVRSAANGSTAANATHYAVCYLGGVGDAFTDDAKAGFVEAVQWLRTEGNAGDDVNGHRDHKATDCPGGVIYTWLHVADFDPEPPKTRLPKRVERYRKKAKVQIAELLKARRVTRRRGEDTGPITRMIKLVRRSRRIAKRKVPRR